MKSSFLKRNYLLNFIIYEKMFQVEFIQKNPFRNGKGLSKLPFALAGSFRLLITLYAGLLIMLALTDFLENAATGTLPLKPFERTFQGLIFTNTDLRHSYPSSRSTKRLSDPENRHVLKTALLL